MPDAPLRVKLDAILEWMGFQGDEHSSYLNRRTGKVETIGDEEFQAAENKTDLAEFPEWQHEGIRIAGDILETDDYLALPDRFDIDQYRIMEQFCLTVEDDRLRDDLLWAIRGRGAFRLFKDRVHGAGIADDWYRFRDEALKQLAREWCEANGIDAVE